MFENYGLVIINKTRYYRIDLANIPYSLEFCVPYRLTVEGREFNYNAWSTLIQKIAETFLLEKHISDEDALKASYEWSDKVVFSKEPLCNYKRVSPTLYVNCNNNSQTAGFALRDLLLFFGIDLSKCELIIYRFPNHEPKEVLQYYRNKNKNDFLEYLTISEGYSDANANKIIENIEKLNKFFANLQATYKDIFALNDMVRIESILAKFKQDFKIKYELVKPKNVELCNKYVPLLLKFYRIKYR